MLAGHRFRFWKRVHLTSRKVLIVSFWSPPQNVHHKSKACTFLLFVIHVVCHMLMDEMQQLLQKLWLIISPLPSCRLHPSIPPKPNSMS